MGHTCMICDHIDPFETVPARFLDESFASEEHAP